LVRHSTQAIDARSQKSIPPWPQSLLLVQPSTQRWVGPQTWPPLHCVLLTHSTQPLAATSQCWPFGQFMSVTNDRAILAAGTTCGEPAASVVP